MRSFVSSLLHVIQAYRLDDRYPDMRQYRALAELGMLDERTAEALHRMALLRMPEVERKQNFLPRAPDYEELYPNRAPDLVIGRLVEHEEVPIGLFIDGPMFCIFVGRSGYGKTTAVRSLIRAVGRYNRAHPDTPLLLVICDRKGHDYADAASMLDGRCLHFDACREPLFGLNAPRGVDPDRWINSLASIFCAPAGLKYAWTTMANILRWAVEAMNPHRREPLRWPDFEMLLKIARRIGRRFAAKAEYLDSLIQVLEGIVRASGETFATSRGLAVEQDILSKGLSVAISMPDVEPYWVRRFLTYLLIEHALRPRIQSGHRVTRTQVLFIVDEGDADISQRAEDAFQDGMSPISKAERFGRQFGVGVCIAAGKLGGACRDVLNSANYFFNFAVADAPSMQEAAQTLDIRRSMGILPALEPGECVLRLPGPWARAMLGRIDYVEPNLSLRARFDAPPVMPAVRFEDCPEVCDAMAKLIHDAEAENMRAGLRRKAKLMAEAKRFLELIAEHPWKTSARLWELMGEDVAPGKRKKTLQQLKDHGLIDFERVRSGRAHHTFLLITAKGWQALGKPPPKIPGRGGVAHVNCVHIIARYLAARSARPIIEKLIPNTSHHADVAVQGRDGRWDVFEVVINCESNIVSHLQACFLHSALCGHVTLVACQRKHLKRLEEMIKAEPSLAPYHSRIKYETLDKYMREQPCVSR